MKTVQAYRFALDLTPSQERDVLAHAGAAGVAHNWASARVRAVMAQQAAERTYDVPDEQLTESLSWSLPALRKAWNAAKPDMAPWWREVSKEAFNTGLDALARGLKNWADSRKGAGGALGRLSLVQVPPPQHAVADSRLGRQVSAMAGSGRVYPGRGCIGLRW